MPRRSGKVYRDIGLRPDHNAWLEKHAGGPRGVSKVIEMCIARTMKQADSADRIDLLQSEVDQLCDTLRKTHARMERIASFLEFQVWMGAGRDDTRFNAILDEFEKFNQQEEQANAAE